MTCRWCNSISENLENCRKNRERDTTSSKRGASQCLSQPYVIILLWFLGLLSYKSIDLCCLFDLLNVLELAVIRALIMITNSQCFLWNVMTFQWSQRRQLLKLTISPKKWKCFDSAITIKKRWSVTLISNLEIRNQFWQNQLSFTIFLSKYI